jgi:heme/copper-type cytochrome/quinol oxidase subunit 3
MGRVTEREQAVDVSRLPTIAFGSKSVMFWATISFMVIEGWTLALTVMSYFYLRQNVQDWPPLRTPEPSLLIPTINMLLMLVSIIPAWLAAQAAKQLEKSGVALWLFVNAGMGLVALVLRWYELWAINTRWDTNAYGSVAWLLVGLHGSLLLLDVGDTIGLGFKMFSSDMPPHYFSDTSDNTMYWLFTVLSYVPIYLLVYVGPRFL